MVRDAGEGGAFEERAGQRETQVEALRREIERRDRRRRARRPVLLLWRSGRQKEMRGSRVLVHRFRAGGRCGRSGRAGQLLLRAGLRAQPSGRRQGAHARRNRVRRRASAVASPLALGALHEEARDGLSRQESVNLRYLGV